MINLEKGQYLGTNRQYPSQSALSFIDTAYKEKVFNGWHAHERAHLTLVLNGGNLEKRSKSEKALLAGQVIFYHSQELHRNDHTLFPSRNLNMEIDNSFFSEYGITEQHIARALSAGRLTSLEFTRLFHETIFKNPATPDSLHLLLLSFTQDAGRSTPDWLIRLRELLNDQWDQWPTLSELAAACEVHPVTLSKYFHRYFGCTLGAYMRKLKAQHALAMIRNGRYSLSEICYTCGFADQSHFIRSFKDATGMLPKKFKKF
ncbi:helix-turn-helix domain-containing protein [Mucilaginibacter sp. KACC 22063]|uniref:helix-turn-helix domain-containing protein n=1 Tax=Mucilaginibacter sp. KACC 22063 TaxID=3025666 RepID=UPI002366F510|nr:AraC family transcriptional regulator [Mucilaginibacter sp. KACC 22063]WDF57179.1 AraC family transcriptional regulator [Mucilaginibacter sp. KACC 22063]